MAAQPNKKGVSKIKDLASSKDHILHALTFLLPKSKLEELKKCSLEEVKTALSQVLHQNHLAEAELFRNLESSHLEEMLGLKVLTHHSSKTISKIESSKKYRNQYKDKTQEFVRIFNALVVALRINQGSLAGRVGPLNNPMNVVTPVLANKQQQSIKANIHFDGPITRNFASMIGLENATNEPQKIKVS